MRIFTAVGGTLAMLWAFSGPFVKSYAADAFVEMLKEQGVDPEVFAKTQDQVENINKNINDLNTDADNIKKELGALRSNLGEVSSQIEDINRSTEKVERLVDKLLTIQLQRADMSSSPPGSGPVGLPKLGQTP